MFKGMGIQWASTLLGCVAAALIPIPIIFYYYGERIRGYSSFAPTVPTGISPPAATNEAVEDEQDGEKQDDEQNDAAAGSVPTKDRQAAGNIV